jgi:hypothetical protein
MRDSAKPEFRDHSLVERGISAKARRHRKTRTNPKGIPKE